MKKNLTNKMINHSISGKNKEDHIHSILTKNGFAVKREVVISDGRFQQARKTRSVDIKFTYGKMERYLESDGQVHGTLEQPTIQTLKRNADFERTNLPYIIINHESIRELRKIMELKNITIEQLTEFLTTYLAWMEYSKFLAKLEAGSLYL
ncbi:hypothetical protein [Nitrososphaeria virus YSH_922147]|uniref:Uncharacterized protein n=1 Tax=Nitrososphaeria virus YSH_922147 TaxID=3071323 RepID=A0A976UBF4_9CAUD|nr:hypothetical protein QKV94_gp58 [Yangshan Harbor Nitrososphaeria virus]UVF62467.1 hypothetical protein [Nitrososphaeria virus YSH_922147]